MMVKPRHSVAGQASHERVTTGHHLRNRVGWLQLEMSSDGERGSVVVQ